MNEFIKAEKSRIGGMLAGYNKQVEDITTEMLGIDAKYKALAKKEKEALSAALSVLKDLIKGASKMYAMLEEEEPKQTDKDEDKTVIPDENEQVVDTLFPENNKEESSETPVETEDQGPEFDGAGFTEADNIPPSTDENTENNDNSDESDDVSGRLLDNEEEEEEEIIDDDDDDEDKEFEELSQNW